jgi:hypothetical protein
VKLTVYLHVELRLKKGLRCCTRLLGMVLYLQLHAFVRGGECLTVDWTGVRFPAAAVYCYSNLSVNTSSGAHPASCLLNAGVASSAGKVRPGRDTDHSLPSRAEVKNEKELHLLFPQATPWRVATHLYIHSSLFQGKN